MLRRISVFIPCFRASLMRSGFLGSSAISPLFGIPICLAISFRSTRGSLFHAAPTSHHLPLLSAEWRSARDKRSGSCPTAVIPNQLNDTIFDSVRGTHHVAFCSNLIKISSSSLLGHHHGFVWCSASACCFSSWSKFQP